MDLCFSIPTFYMYCFLLGALVRDFVPEWESKGDKISLHPAGRPLVAQLSESNLE